MDSQSNVNMYWLTRLIHTKKLAGSMWNSLFLLLEKKLLHIHIWELFSFFYTIIKLSEVNE